MRDMDIVYPKVKNVNKNFGFVFMRLGKGEVMGRTAASICVSKEKRSSGCSRVPASFMVRVTGIALPAGRSSGAEKVSPGHFFNTRPSPPVSDIKEQQTKSLLLFYGAGNRGRTCTVAHRILNPARLPIPPYPHTDIIAYRECFVKPPCGMVCDTFYQRLRPCGALCCASWLCGGEFMNKQ